MERKGSGTTRSFRFLKECFRPGLLVPHGAVTNFSTPDGAIAFDHLQRLIEQVEAVADLLVGAGDQGDFAC